MSAREALADRLGRWTGLDLRRGGRDEALERLLAQRIQTVGAPSADAYVATLDRADHPEVSWLVNALTVGHTWFFRDGEQAAAIGQLLRDEISRPVRVWVAACATGEEAYTVAMLAEALGVPVEILATDINSRALERAREAEYSPWSVREVPREMAPMLEPTGAGRVRVSAAARRHVRFERHNLVDVPPSPQVGVGWHVILCRNVLIYFRRADVPATAERLANALAPGGWLVFGAGEVLQHVPPGFALTPMGAQTGARYALRRLQARAGVGAPVRATPPFPASTTATAFTGTTAFAAPPAASPSPPACPAPPPAPAPTPSHDDILERALERIEGGQSGEAIVLCALVLQQDPLSPQAHLVSGIAFHMSDDPRSAAHALRSALLLDPDEWVASFYLALSYEKLGREEDARRAYAQAHRASQSKRPRQSRLRLLEAYRDEISSHALSRSLGL